MPVEALKSRSELAWLQLSTMVLGVAAVVVLSILGRMLALVAALSFVGIPVAFLLAAIPTLFLLNLFALGFALVFRLGSGKRILIAYGLALGVLFFIPMVHNRLGIAYMENLVSGDRNLAVEPWRGGTMALVVPNDADVACGELCQKMLGKGLAERFAVASIPVGAGGLEAVRKTVAYRLEAGTNCKPPATDAPLEPSFQLKLAQGACLKESPGELPRVDAILWPRVMHGDAVAAASLNPFHLPMVAKRFSLYQRRGGAFPAEVWRETSASYATLYPLLVPTFILTKAAMEAPDSGLLREVKSAGKTQVPEVEEFLQSRMQVDLSKVDVSAAELQKSAVATMLRQATGTNGVDPGQFAALLKDLRLGKELDLPLERVKSLLNTTVRNGRVPLSEDLQVLVSAAYRKDPEIGNAVADAVAERLERELKVDPGESSRDGNLNALAGAIRWIPDAHFAHVWPQVRGVTLSMREASRFQRAIERAWLAGNAAPDLLGLMELQMSAKDNILARKAVLHPAMGSLCKAAVAGRAGKGALPGFAALLEKQGFLPDSLPQNQLQAPSDFAAVAKTLVALGADHEFVTRLKLSAYVGGKLKPQLEDALRRPGCKFD